MAMTPWLLGIHVNRNVGLEPLVGSQSARRLEEMSGRAPLASWARLGNVWEPDEETPIEMAWQRLGYTRALQNAIQEGAPRVVFLGTAAAKCLVLPEHGRFVNRGTHWASTMVTWWPHPSGLNRWWNDLEHVLEARQWWSQLAAASD